tara:strand:- start:616 stop:1278 length:663 start_codon:yes stop_codon:yes gene_type:complete
MHYQMRLEKLSQSSIDSVKESFNRLPHTDHLDGQYRLRRYSTIRLNSGNAFSYIKLPQQEFEQSEHYNKHQGGMSRSFEDLEDEVVGSLGMLDMCDRFLEAGAFGESHPIEIHQMRIITTGEKTPVSPEGVHRDGYDFIAIVGVDRHNISGGNAQVHKTYGGKPIFDCPLSVGEILMINDRELWHNATDIYRLDPSKDGYMDAFILTAKYDRKEQNYEDV